MSEQTVIVTEPDQLRRLSLLLAMPDQDALEALKEMLPAAPWLAPALPELEGLPAERWQTEHTRLFVSGFPKTPCPPFESAYRQGGMGGTSAGDLARLYRNAGLEATAVSADYLGTMLEFAAYLLEQGNAWDLLNELWSEHLERWVPRFARDLETHSRLQLYRTLGAELAKLFATPKT